MKTLAVDLAALALFRPAAFVSVGTLAARVDALDSFRTNVKRTCVSVLRTETNPYLYVEGRRSDVHIERRNNPAPYIRHRRTNRGCVIPSHAKFVCREPELGVASPASELPA